ncbi:radical SAM protein [Halioxenophilus aromaticivorans]|uniref:Oxygen-independent coproporphyrinogen III oxidase n=1 Tax=Halioxenophilus aromaticivorans TaxID=1306992 RepID=A0AAV3U6A0_9ALTE
MAGSAQLNSNKDQIDSTSQSQLSKNPLLWYAASFDDISSRTADIQHAAENCPALALSMHIPFASNSHSFFNANTVVTRQYSLASHFIDNLCCEIAHYGEMIYRSSTNAGKKPVVDSLTITGGNPTFLIASDLARTLECLNRHFHLAEATQRDFCITVEAKTFDDDLAKLVKQLGFNRIRLCLEDFSPEVQFSIQRKYSVYRIESAIEAAKAAEIPDVSIDLIYGLPTQSAASFLATLQHLIRFKPDDITLHLLQHQSGSYGLSNTPALLPKPQAITDLQNIATTYLLNQGYSVSGAGCFAIEPEVARPNQRGAYNSNQLALGLGTASLIKPFVWQNCTSLREYTRRISQLGHARDAGLELSSDQAIRAEVAAGLLATGTLLKDGFEAKWQRRFDDYFEQGLALLAPFIERHEIDNNSDFRLTPTGLWQAAAVAKAILWPNASPPCPIKD